VFFNLLSRLSGRKSFAFDFSALSAYGEANPVIRPTSPIPKGPGLSWLGDTNFVVTPPDPERTWKSLGKGAWEILRRRRAMELFPNDECEFDRYIDLLRRSGPKYRGQVFIGVRHGGYPLYPEPVLVPHHVFAKHAYILGGTGRWKTSYAIAELLVQLHENYVDEHGKSGGPPPIIIFDMKFNGDRYLRSLAEKLAAARGQKLNFFSNNPDFQSLQFDPLHCFRSIKYPLKLAETLSKAFSLVYPEGYGPTFYTNEQRIKLEEILYSGRPKSYDELVDFVRKETVAKKGNKDARGLYSALASLKYAEHVHTDGSPIESENLIDFERVLENREVLYIHLDTRGLSMTSKDIGRLLIFAMAETAAQREQDGKKVQTFVVLDEFQRLAARNIVEMAEDARSSGIAFLFCHQSSKSLLTHDKEDLFGILFDNCSYKQFLTLHDERIIDQLRAISGSTIQILHGGGSTIGGGMSTTFGSSSGSGPSGCTSGNSYSQSATSSYSVSSNWREELVPGFTPDMIPEVHANKLVSIVQINVADKDSLTPLGGIPTLVQGLFPFSRDTAIAMAQTTWPRNPDRDDAYYYRKAKPRISRVVVENAPPQAKSKARVAEDAPLLFGPQTSEEVRAQSERAGRVKQLSERLSPHMIKAKAPAQ
jgi:hypothetical protein